MEFLSILDHFLAVVHLSEGPVLENTNPTGEPDKFIADKTKLAEHETQKSISRMGMLVPPSVSYQHPQPKACMSLEPHLNNSTFPDLYDIYQLSRGSFPFPQKLQ